MGTAGLMGWERTPPLEAFAEALSVPAMLHTPLRNIRVLVVGVFAIPLAKLALRYPSTREVVVVAEPSAPLPRDRRLRRVSSIEDIEQGWRADVAALAVPGSPETLAREVKRMLTPDGLMVVAVDTFSRGRSAKDGLQQLLTHVVPYREYAPEPVLFLLASDRRIGRPLRPVPPGLSRITKGYLPALFCLGKDEYHLLYGDRKEAS